ncbi:MAG TPA: hypothetical protein VG101_01695 [Puia sp.]|jgi:hypothetical protein|nr:hypothetical protein [Puia sp.]
MKRLIIIWLLSGLGLAGCKKSGPGGLPPITEEGKNTFGFKVNEEVWVPYDPCRIGASITALGYSFSRDTSFPGDPLKWEILIANNNQDGGSSFIIHPFYPFTGHIYGVGNIIDSIWIEFWGPAGNAATYDEYRSLQPLPGNTDARYFQITKLDTVNKIISGVFAFTLLGGQSIAIYSNGVETTRYDSVIITDGRFDLRLDAGSHCN